MRVLLTGAFGGLGRFLLRELLMRHEVRTFDLDLPGNRRAARATPGAEHVWGDLRDPAAVEAAVRGVDAVIHNAFIIYPHSESRPDAEAINVGGTQNVLAAMARHAPAARLIFASSYHVHPWVPDRGRPLRVTDPVAPRDVYAQHKLRCEELVRSAGQPFTILRLSSILLDRKPEPATMRVLFSIPLETRFELVHPEDAALGFVNALSCPEAVNQTYFVGGGPSCQTTYEQFCAAVFDAQGLGAFPREAFSKVPFIGDWLDTSDSQVLLRYQRSTLAEYYERQRRRGVGRAIVSALSPLVRWWLLRSSESWRARGRALPSSTRR